MDGVDADSMNIADNEEEDLSELYKSQFDYFSPDKAEYRFDSLTDEAKTYLETNGYVVISNVLSSKELENAIELVWKYLKSINWRRNDASSWDAFPGYAKTGVIFKHGVGQSDAQWYIRTCPKVLEAFSKMWNVKETELLSSFDGIGIFRPYDKIPSWKTQGQWYHVDQNPKSKPNLDCYQGLVTLYDQNEYSGGTVVIPKTHSSFEDIFSTVSFKSNKNLIRVPGNHWVLKQQKLLICTKAGDLVMWDSRTIHCNTPALISHGKQLKCVANNESNKNKNENENKNENANNDNNNDNNNDKNNDKNNDNNNDNNNNNNNNNDDNKYNCNDDDNNNKKNKDFVRLVSYICMTPKAKASKTTIENRKLAYQNDQTTTHMPHDFFLAGPAYSKSKESNVVKKKNKEPNSSSEIVKSLVGY